MDAEPAIVDRTELDALFGALRERGYTVVGPTVRSQSLVYDELAGADDLPAGWVDVQDGGTFRLQRGDDEALFAHTVGHDSLKRFLFPPQLAVWRARRGADGALEVQEPAPAPRYAFIGVRSCDLHAVAIQDRVFMGDRYVDADYEARRRDAFFVAVNCGQAGGTCFCASMDTGPARDGRLRPGADRAARRRRPPLRGRGRQRARRRGARDAIDHRAAGASEAGRAATRPPSAPRPRWAARSTSTDIRDLLHGQPRAPALGRGRRPLPELRQLHDGLPDLLLHHRRGRHRPGGRRGRAHAAVGLVLHARALLRPRRQRAPDRPLALPAVDDAQARDLDRPVRHLGLRRLRALHHLVPGRASTSPRRPRRSAPPTCGEAGHAHD